MYSVVSCVVTSLLVSSELVTVCHCLSVYSERVFSHVLRPQAFSFNLYHEYDHRVYVTVTKRYDLQCTSTSAILHFPYPIILHHLYYTILFLSYLLTTYLASEEINGLNNI